MSTSRRDPRQITRCARAPNTSGSRTVTPTAIPDELPDQLAAAAVVVLPLRVLHDALVVHVGEPCPRPSTPRCLAAVSGSSHGSGRRAGSRSAPKLPFLHSLHECTPLARCEYQRRSGWVFRVADGHYAGQVASDFHAVGLPVAPSALLPDCSS